MKYFFPFGLDAVDPTFEFGTETRSSEHQHREDMHPHEVYDHAPFDGLLLSKGVVEGGGHARARFTLAQQARLRRVGVSEFFRLDVPGDPHVLTMGDCGAFNYMRQDKPPFGVDEVLAFYDECDFDFGIAVDHIISAYSPEWDRGFLPEKVRDRQELTLELAAEFWEKHRAAGPRFYPMGVAQGWSPRSYARSVAALQKIGYDYIAVGGIVPLTTDEILACLEGIDTVRNPGTRLHLLGIGRIGHTADFMAHGAVSCDSTSPFRQAFTGIYLTMGGDEYMSIRVRQVEKSPELRKRIEAGLVSQEHARETERRCMDALADYDQGRCDVEDALAAIRAYEEVQHPGMTYETEYRRTLEARPWKECPCDVCEQLGFHVILFRGNDRNRPRAFHNLWTHYRRFGAEVVAAEKAPARGGGAWGPLFQRVL